METVKNLFLGMHRKRFQNVVTNIFDPQSVVVVVGHYYKGADGVPFTSA